MEEGWVAAQWWLPAVVCSNVHYLHAGWHVTAQHKWGVLHTYSDKPRWVGWDLSTTWIVLHHWANRFQQPHDFYLLQGEDWAGRHRAWIRLGVQLFLLRTGLFLHSSSSPAWQGRRTSVWGRELHPAFPLWSSLLPITPLLEANLMFPTEHHESAGLRPIMLWLFVIMTLGRTAKKSLKWIKKSCMLVCTQATSTVLHQLVEWTICSFYPPWSPLIIPSLHLSPDP